MQEPEDLNRIIADVRYAATKAGSLVVESGFSVERVTLPVVSIDTTAFADLISKIKPRIVYLRPLLFDVAEAIEESVEVESETVLGQPPIKKLHTKWKARDGQAFRVFIAFVIESVVHVAVEDANWFEDFESELEGLSEFVEAHLEAESRSSAVAELERIRPMVTQLRSDPRFSGPKVGVAKRTILAKALFPKLDDATIRDIVERAEGEHWLATSLK